MYFIGQTQLLCPTYGSGSLPQRPGNPGNKKRHIFISYVLQVLEFPGRFLLIFLAFWRGFYFYLFTIFVVFVSFYFIFFFGGRADAPILSHTLEYLLTDEFDNR